MKNLNSSNPLSPSPLSLAFEAVSRLVAARRADFNQSDTLNGDHGDHLLQAFTVAASRAATAGDTDIVAAMHAVASDLAALPDNGTAQVYALGLDQFANQLERYQVSQDELLAFARSLSQDDANAANSPSLKERLEKGDVLKALVNGLSAWNRAARGETGEQDRLEMGTLFDLGIIYMQAKQRNSSRLDVLADAAASASPLSLVPHRHASGKLVIRTLLESLSTTID